MAIKRTTGFKQDGMDGGWCTAIPHTQLEPNQVPDVMNMTLDSDGNLRKREGVLDMGRSLTTTFNYVSTLIPIACSNGNHIIIAVNGANIQVYAYDSVITTGQPWITTITFNNVFNTTVQSKRLNHQVIQEKDFTKVILTNSRHVPIQLVITSGKTTVTKSNGTNGVWTSIPTPPQVLGLANTNFIAWVNGAVNTVSAYTKASAGYTNASFTTSTSYANGTYTFAWTAVSWQWWAEALKLDKAQVTSTEVQGTSTQYVPVPQDLLYDISPYTSNRFPMFVYNTSAFDAKHTYTNPPTTSSQWTWSTGAGGSSGVSQLPASPDWVAFGAAPTSPRTVLFTRGYKLPFQGGRGLHTFNAGSLQQNHSVISYYTPYIWDRQLTVPVSEGGAGTGHATMQAYYIRKVDFTVSTSNASTYGEGIYMTFDASGTPAGALSYTGGGDVMFVVDTCSKVMFDNGWLGSGAGGSGTYNYASHTFISSASNNEPMLAIYSTGIPHPIFGISDYCNYYLGYFPDVVSTFQRRVVLAGMPHNPMQIIFSNIEDNHAVPGLYCNNFQTALEYDYDTTCAFDITLPSYADDTIIAMREYADSLFVWTKYKLFRIYAGNSETIAFNTVKYATVAEIGCVNGQSAIVAGNTPIFMSSDGVYAVLPDNTASGYSVKELSINIRDFFLSNNSTITSVGMLLYDAARKELFVVTSAGHPMFGGELLVYNTVYEAWTRMSWLGQKHSYIHSGCVAYRDLVAPDVLFLTQMLNAASVNLIKLHHTENVDVLYRTVYSASPLSIPFNNSGVQWTTTNGTLNYNFPTYYAVDSTRSKSLRLSPVLSVEDCIVTLNGVRQTFGTQYTKTPYGIRLASNPGAGATLICYPGWNYNGTVYPPIVVIQSGVMHYPNEFSIDVAATTITFNGSFVPSVGVVIDVASVYNTWVLSPGLTLDTLKTKNAAHYLGYFDNRNTYVSGQRFNVNLAILFDDSFGGITSEELFGDYETLLAQSDLYGEQQYKPYARVMVPLMGSGYVLNAVHYVNSPCTFKMIGYELQVPQTNRQLFSYEEE